MEAHTHTSGPWDTCRDPTPSHKFGRKAAAGGGVQRIPGARIKKPSARVAVAAAAAAAEAAAAKPMLTFSGSDGYQGRCYTYVLRGLRGRNKRC